MVLPGSPGVTMWSFTGLACFKKPKCGCLFDPYGTGSTHLTHIMSQNETDSQLESPEMDGLVGFTNENCLNLRFLKMCIPKVTSVSVLKWSSDLDDLGVPLYFELPSGNLT